MTKKRDVRTKEFHNVKLKNMLYIATIMINTFINIITVIIAAVYHLILSHFKVIAQQQFNYT